MKDRLSTLGLLQRHNMDLPSYDCVLCSTHSVETVEHLFLHCPFALDSWSLVSLQVPQLIDPHLVLQAFKENLAVPFFMEIIVLLAWSIWVVGIYCMFSQISLSVQACKSKFIHEFVSHRAKMSYFPLISDWLDFFCVNLASFSLFVQLFNFFLIYIFIQ